MNKIKEKLIHWLGGVTKEEYENMQALSNSALAHLNESHKALQASLRALEHAVEDSRATGRVNIVRTEKPMITFKAEVRLDLYHESLNMDKVSEEEVVRMAHHVIVDKIANYLDANNLIDFKMSGETYDTERVLSGTVYVREP